ncbi:phosphoribosylformylglycinamidine synthase subunit PurS [Elusimicrobium minutum]|uniref:phosphoribosylformylglycinamidine synthase subunit PurS n=1 Tax=Elusimicrobium minutum TaxID=423605 RepID=UPI0001618DD1|nr:phosphoribosylformylglycinamidine synthase subunit PurS [Elusimicrobium minutum]
MKYFVEVFHKRDYGSHKENGIKNRLSSVGLKGIENVNSYTIYSVEGVYSKKQIESIAKDLLCDPVLEKYSVSSSKPQKGVFKIEVWIRDSSTDVVGEGVKDAVAALGFEKPASVRVAAAFNISGKFTEKELDAAVKKTFVNQVVNKYLITKGA